MLRLLLVLLLTLPAVARADSDHDRALLLRHQGEILPFSEILQRVNTSHPGQVLEVELKERKPHPVYKIEMLGDDGVVREVSVDAVNGSILKEKED
ncbi:MAG TPA: PepSY domain-containing protein [Mariprofundaceae bacterium]|nr:PepSY domain-containing protein [Mariprofundaceae bacterium]